MSDAVTPDDAVRAELDRLAELLRRGDPEALARCYDLLADLLASIALGILRDPDDAEDAVQDAFVSFVRNADTIRGDGRSVRAWLVQAVRSRSLDRIRAASRRHEVTSGQLPEPDDPDRTDQTVAAVPNPRFEATFRQLSEAQRTALILYHVHGLSGQETAAAMGRTREAVYALLRRAEAALRRGLEQPSNPAPVARLNTEGGGL